MPSYRFPSVFGSTSAGAPVRLTAKQAAGSPDIVGLIGRHCSVKTNDAMNVLMPVADGSEEMEVVIVADTFRRAKWNVVLAGLGAGAIRASRGVRLMPDVAWADVTPEDFNMLVIPGGWDGVMAMAKDERLLASVRAFMANGKWVGAICAGPLVLQAADVLQGRRVTCHPGVADELAQTSRLNDRVVVDGRLVTSQAPGTALEFALALVRAVEGDRKAVALAKEMVINI